MGDACSTGVEAIERSGDGTPRRQAWTGSVQEPGVAK